MPLSIGVDIYIYIYIYIYTYYIYILLRIKLSKRQALYQDTLWYDPCVKGTITGNHCHDTTVSNDSDAVIYIYIYTYIHIYLWYKNCPGDVDLYLYIYIYQYKPTSNRWSTRLDLYTKTLQISALQMCLSIVSDVITYIYIYTYIHIHMLYQYIFVTNCHRDVVLYPYKYICIYIHTYIIKTSTRLVLYIETLRSLCSRGTNSGDHYDVLRTGTEQGPLLLQMRQSVISDVVIYIYIYIYIFPYVYT